MSRALKRAEWRWKGEFVEEVDAYLSEQRNKRIAFYAYTEYNVWDLSNNQLVWESGCYNGNYDHLCTLEDVEEFLKAEYEKAGLTW